MDELYSTIHNDELFPSVHMDELLQSTLTSSSLQLTWTSSSQQLTLTSSPLQHTWLSSTQQCTQTSPACQFARTSSTHPLALMTSATNRTSCLRNQDNACKVDDVDNGPNLTSSTYTNRTTWEPGQLELNSIRNLNDTGR